MSVNKKLPEPKSQWDWVDSEYCKICGELYKKFNSGVQFSDGVDIVRYHNYNEGGGYRSRGPVLWAMRTLKLEYWYEKHRLCGEINDR